MAARQPGALAQLGPAAAAAAGAAPGGGFDAVQSGCSLWAAALTGESSVAVVHACTSGRSRVCELHTTLSLPEPVALAQLGAPTCSGGEAAAAPGPAVLLLVSPSCRVWAFQLQPLPLRAASIGVEVGSAAGMAVPLAQAGCPAAPQLAAAVAWEHLSLCWEAGPLQNGGGAGAGGGRTQPVSLAGLAAALARFAAAGWQAVQQPPPLLLHSVASWACQPPPAGQAPAIPPDATAAAYVSLAAAAGAPPRLACSARFELPEGTSGLAGSSGGGGGGPAGYLLLATAAGQLLALPVGTPAGGEHVPAEPRHRLPLAVCSSGSSMCFLPVAASGGQAAGSQPPQELVLLPEAGQLAPAGPAGLGGTPALLCGGGAAAGGAGESAGAASSAAQLFAATVQLVGVQAAAVAGRCLWYVPAGSGGTCRGLRRLDASAGLLQSRATEVPGGGAAVLLAAAMQATHSQQQQEQPPHVLALLSAGVLVAMPRSPPSEESGLPPMRRLEGSVQGLLGAIASLSEEQERMAGQLRRLDAGLADLAATIPAAEAVAAGGAAAAAGGRLHCRVRPLRLRSHVLGSSGGGGGSSGSGSEALILEVQLRNASRLPLAPGWSMVVAFAAAGGSSGRGSDAAAVALAAPLPGLAAGAAWQQECQVPLPASGGAAGGHLRVLLCRHGSGGASALLLHSMQLDALHLLQLGGGSALGPARSGPSGPQAEDPLRARLLLQLPSALCGLSPAAEPLLQQLLEQGWSSEPGPMQQQQRQQAPPCPAFSLLLPLPEQQHVGSGGGQAAAACSSSSGSGAHLSAQLSPAAGHPASAAAARLLRVDVAAASPAALLSCHHGLCRRALGMSEAGSLRRQLPQQEPPWPALAGGFLLPPAGPHPAAAAAVDDAQLEAALGELRRLRDAAVRLRNEAAAAAAAAQQDSGGGGAAERHAAQRRRLEGARELALAARAAAGGVPVVVP